MTKRKNEDEKRTKKVTMTFTSAIFDNLRDLSYMKRLSVSSYVAELVEKDAELNAENLKLFRNLTPDTEV